MSVKRPLAERFWEKVDKRGPAECWPWVATRTPGGYGQIKAGGRDQSRFMAHRVSLMLATGALDPALEVLHECDHPWCVNPAHLRQGTHQENLRDAKQKGRMKGAGSFPGKILSDAAVSEMLGLRAEGLKRAALAKRFGVSIHTVNSVVYGQSWVHVPRPVARRSA